MPARKLARIFGIVDNPDNRKQHGKAIPPIGGLVIFTVFMIFGVFSGVIDLNKYWPLFVSLVILLSSGAIDDQFHIDAKIKFFIHILVACIIAFMGNVQAAYMGNLFGFGTVWTGFFSYPFTIIAIVLLINAMNLLDGMDGLAGGVSVVIFLWLLIAALFAGWFDYVSILALLIACIAGFLVFNMRNPWRRKASLFLGDAGSMSLGLCIAWFSVLLARSPETPIEPISVAWLIGFPIFDTCAQFYRRVRAGQDPFAPDRGHFHHHFIDAGVPVRSATIIIILIVAIMGAIGYGGIAIGVPPFVLTIAWVALLFIHITLSSKPERYVRIIKSFASSKKSSFALFLILPLLFLSSCVNNISLPEFISSKNNGEAWKPSEKLEAKKGVSSKPALDKTKQNPQKFVFHKKINTEKLLNAQGNWNIVEQGRNYDPAQAHLQARKKVNIRRKGKMPELVAHFKPDAKSGQDGKLRVLRIDSAKVDLSDVPRGYNVTESTVVKPTQTVADNDLIKKITSLFGSSGSSGSAVGEKYNNKAAIDAIIPPRKPFRTNDNKAAVVSINNPSIGANSSQRMDLASSNNMIIPPDLPQKKSSAKPLVNKAVVNETIVNYISGGVPIPKRKPARANNKINKPKQVKDKVVILNNKPSGLGKRASVVKMRAGAHPDNMTRVVIEVTNITKYKVAVDHLRNVLRLKLENTDWGIGDKGNISGSALLGSYISRPQKDGSTLLEIRLKKKAKISDTMILRPNLTYKHRIVIDLKAL